MTERTTESAAEADHVWRPDRFMVIVAHPDDADFGPAATAARWIDAGSQGWLVCCTSGDQGGEDPDADPLVPGAGTPSDCVPPDRRRRWRPGPRRDGPYD